MTSVAKDRIVVRHHKLQIPGCKYSLNYLDIIMYSFEYMNITM